MNDRHGNFIDELGNQYEQLLVIKEAGKTDTGYITWECVCDCGNTVTAIGSELRHGRKTHCGHATSLPEGEAAFNSMYRQYKWQAANKNREFDLMPDEFRNLTLLNCYWCGIGPEQCFGTTRYNGAYVHNGIDRLDNSKGYITENCVPCCGQCNMAKRDLSASEFSVWIRRLVSHNE